jgi:hypothetical protein
VGTLTAPDRGATGALFGIYLYASSRWWNLNHNDAFSAMRLDSHRNFPRLRIKDDAVTIYPIGLDRVPRGVTSGAAMGRGADRHHRPMFRCPRWYRD